MDFKINKDTGRKSTEKHQDEPAEKKNQTPQLLLLLLLLAGFGYVYFFTGVIKPLPESKTELPPPPQVVKKALPPREAAVTSDAQDKVKAAGDAQQSATPPVPQVASGEAAKKDASPQVQPPPASPAKVQSAVKPEAVVSGDKKIIDPKEVKQKQPEKKTSIVAAKKKEISAVTAQKTSSPSKKQELDKKPETVVKTKKTATMPAAASWTLIVGNYLLESEMAADMARVRKAGLEPSITAEKRIKAKVNRLYLGEYDERAAAQALLDKLKRQTADAFMLQQGEKFAVFAGSYLLEDRVAEERERLKAAGFSPTIKKVDVALPAKGLSAGIFSDKKSAEAARAKLIAAGLAKATLLECK
ncbi:MAG: hypothetical protein A2079_02085 [Geobacteraceae bacterium GWC2_48_7]|nr:MAG: hypothetical protein A2079_02085 [Geobacteraceae bacterium GWC2_48_7]